MGVGWPPENTMNLKIVEAVYTVVTGEPGHPDQYPYTDSWLGLAQDPPTWTRFCIQKGKGKILMAQKLMIKREILQDLEGDDLTLAPYWIMTCLPPSAPAGPEATLMPNPGPGEVPAAATALPPALPEFAELLFWQAPIPAVETSGQCPQKSISAGPPRLCPPLPVSTDGTGKKTQQLDRGCTPPRNRGNGST